MYSKLDRAEICNLMYENNLAGELYPKDIASITKMIDEYYVKDKYNEEDIATITRQLITMNLNGFMHK